MQKTYVIGLDYGTLSGRCLLVDCRDGKEVAESVYEYPHAVMSEELPCGKKLPAQFALQHPQDYLDVLTNTIPDVLKKAGVAPEEIAGIGMDFTACTLLPVDREGIPLCFDERFASEPHAYVKLWKHHAAQPQADRINQLATERDEAWLQTYGGKISSEWALPKILEVLEKAPEVYAATDRFTEAADALSRILTGTETHSAAFAGFKALWNAETGYPSDEFMTALHPGLHGIVGTKLSTNVCGMNRIAGKLNSTGAALTGLPEGTPLALPMIDAHAAMPALGISGAGELMMILGTSSCHIVNGRDEKKVLGICGCVKDGVIPGYYCYEAGQSATGDIFDWYVKQNVPASYAKEAESRGISVHKLLREKAMKLRPGESGLLALDWLNGNRSVLMDSALTGMVLGMTLNTRPEEIYRAWIEATAYGTRMIMENFADNGIAINSIVAAGGIAQKDEMMMQIYADVTGRRIRVAGTTQAGALGSAIYASVAGGCFQSLADAEKALAKPAQRVYTPIEVNHGIYSKLYAEYKTLHDYFGRGENDVMKRLADISRQQPQKELPLEKIFQAKTFRASEGTVLNYRIYVPAIFEKGKKYPLVLFLHGAGERGDDNRMQLKIGITEPFKKDDSVIRQCIVIAPQCPVGQQWQNYASGQDCQYQSDRIEESIQQKAVVELLKEVIALYPVDEDRVYATGLSMGGFGTWDLLLRHGELFAAAIPVCGGCDTSKFEQYIDFPIWTFHGLKDTVVPPTGTTEMVKRIREAGGTRIRYHEYPEMGHAIWGTAYAEQGLFEWLLEQKRSDRTK